MKKYQLGKTGIEVTELCFGALPMGPLQKNMDEHAAAAVTAAALRGGVTFIDTAQAYSTYTPKACNGDDRHKTCNRFKEQCGRIQQNGRRSI